MLLLDKMQKKNYNKQVYRLLRRRERPTISSNREPGKVKAGDEDAAGMALERLR